MSVNEHKRRMSVLNDERSPRASFGIIFSLDLLESLSPQCLCVAFSDGIINFKKNLGPD